MRLVNECLAAELKAMHAFSQVSLGNAYDSTLIIFIIINRRLTLPRPGQRRSEANNLILVHAFNTTNNILLFLS